LIKQVPLLLEEIIGDMATGQKALIGLDLRPTP
jgi:hypothetical protein